MPAIVAPSPDMLSWMLQQLGWSLKDTTSYNWMFINEASADPVLTLSRRGDVVPMKVFDVVMERTGLDLNRYFELRGEWSRLNAA
jgi:hypothetical protein